MIIKKDQQKIKQPVHEEINEEEITEQQVIKEKTDDETEIMNLFDLDNIDFSQRSENRRGSRRRGFRRIDDRNLISRAKEEAESIKENAYNEGYKNGIEKAAADITNLQEQLKAFMNAKEDVFQYIAPDILEISSDIAKKIIKQEIETNPQIIFNTIIDILKNVSKGEPKIAIKVHPDDVKFVKENLPEKVESLNIDSKIGVMADPSLKRGDCKFITNNGIVDASIETQLEIIHKALRSI